MRACVYFGKYALATFAMLANIVSTFVRSFAKPSNNTSAFVCTFASIANMANM